MTATVGDTPVAPPEPTGSPAPASYPVLRWLTLATFVVILNETLMVNAIPRLMAQFDVTARTGQWLSTAFMLTMAVVIPVTGWFLQRVTTRRAFAGRYGAGEHTGVWLCTSYWHFLDVVWVCLFGILLIG